MAYQQYIHVLYDQALFKSVAENHEWLLGFVNQYSLTSLQSSDSSFKKRYRLEVPLRTHTARFGVQTLSNCGHPPLNVGSVYYPCLIILWLYALQHFDDLLVCLCDGDFAFNST